MNIIIKSPAEIAVMRRAGKVVVSVLQTLSQEITAGMRTSHLNDIAARELKKYGAQSSFKGYHGFPAVLCVSLNEEIVHGIPGKTKIRDGDIVSMDFGAIVDGYQGDAAITVGVGKINRIAAELMEATRGSLEVGISQARDGAHLGDISCMIQQYAESRGYSVIREYTGHGIGRQMHEDPLIPNFGFSGEGPVLRKGMTLAIEPMLTVGSWKTKVLRNNWTVVTADNSLSAHFERTIVVTDSAPEILTDW